MFILKVHIMFKFASNANLGKLILKIVGGIEHESGTWLKSHEGEKM